MERDRPQSEGEIRCIIKYISARTLRSAMEYVALIPIIFFAIRGVIIMKSWEEIAAENEKSRSGTVENNCAAISIIVGMEAKN